MALAFNFTFLFDLQNKEEVMAVRLREADSIAAVAELQQHIAELEIQVIFSAQTCFTLIS